jgi:hypothetical protein
VETMKDFALWVVFLVGALGMGAAGLWFLDRLLTRLLLTIKAYDALLDFVWHRKEFKEWLRAEKLTKDLDRLGERAKRT